MALARCLTCSTDYLLLDSKDYWFDVIQKGYPRLSRCSCKNESFQLRIDYNIRGDGDVDYIEVHSICSACGKTRRQLDFEVDYCGTDHLLKKPLVPCKNPKVLYDLKNINLLVTLPDIVRIVDHLTNEKCEFLSNLRRRDTWVPVRQDAAEAKVTIEESKYLFIYALPNHIEVPGRPDQYDQEGKRILEAIRGYPHWAEEPRLHASVRAESTHHLLLQRSTNSCQLRGNRPILLHRFFE
jgi:hypothetical protein